MNYQKDVSNFMILGEQKIASDLNLKNEQTQLYMNLIKEEFEETAKAFDEEDLIEVADGLADLENTLHRIHGPLNQDLQEFSRCRGRCCLLHEIKVRHSLQQINDSLCDWLSLGQELHPEAPELLQNLHFYLYQGSPGSASWR